MSRHRIPAEIAALHGNPRQRGRSDPPADAVSPLKKLPPPPIHLKHKVARASWREFGERVIALGALTEGDLPLLADAAQVAALLHEARAFLAEHGTSYTTVNARGGRMRRPFPEVSIERDMSKRLLMRLMELGLTPASRTKVRVLRPGTKDPLEDFFGGSSS